MAVCRASEGNIFNLADEILMDILSRLPHKRLIMCKVVSKKFHRLVSTLIHSPTRPRPFSGLFNLQMVYRRYPAFFRYLRKVEIGEIGLNIVMNDGLSFLPCHPNTRVHDIRDGFLLCSTNNRHEYYVCNPFTRQWVHLPRPPKHYGNCNIELSALVLDEPSDVFFCCHYKVVEFATTHGRTPHSDLDIMIDPSKGWEEKIPLDLNVCVYSSRTGQWVESNACLKDIKFCLSEEKSSVFVNGALFFPAFFPANPSQVLMFDLKEEYFKLLDLPTDMLISSFIQCGCLGESEGCLTCACHNGSEMGVWKIDGVDSDWVLMRKIDLNDFGLPDDWKDAQDPLNIVAVHPNLDDVFLRSHKHLFRYYRYDINSRELKMLFSSYYNMSLEINPFSECLCSLADAHRRIQQ
eukprot:TRINITY_DN7091_c0_g1_i2.p1 TRINITY_DN7091_c0_g1~~TRINITY_DN7091_c0_g1_i2.p1  ORF type:complete len:406 (+),score=51.67 TRINITY_DN7091_c0_g1_i2:360-1577(+)